MGLVPAINRFAKEKRQINLAISLHAADDELRTSMLPINKRYPIADLITSVKNYTEQTLNISFEADIGELNNKS